jgi:hypothetical protein
MGNDGQVGIDTARHFLSQFDIDLVFLFFVHDIVFIWLKKVETVRAPSLHC